jgi:hypothetical protein
MEKPLAYVSIYGQLLVAPKLKDKLEKLIFDVFGIEQII